LKAEATILLSLEESLSIEQEPLRQLLKEALKQHFFEVFRWMAEEKDTFLGD
jgi:hypothetical protein